MSERTSTEDLIRDLVHCVQAARDGAEHGSLFALQCDLVLARAAREAPGLITKRAVEHRPKSAWNGPSTWPLPVAFESR